LAVGYGLRLLAAGYPATGYSSGYRLSAIKQQTNELFPPVATSCTASQLDRSDFQSITGSHEGVFSAGQSAEPAAGDHPRGGLVRPGEPVVGSPTHPVMQNLVVLWEMSPLRSGVRAGARLWARGPAPRPPGLGRNWAQTEAQVGWWGPGSAAGGGAAASQGYFFNQEKISAVRPEAGLSSFS
jgi:hypothetical protein